MVLDQINIIWEYERTTFYSEKFGTFQTLEDYTSWFGTPIPLAAQDMTQSTSESDSVSLNKLSFGEHSAPAQTEILEWNNPSNAAQRSSLEQRLLQHIESLHYTVLSSITHQADAAIAIKFVLAKRTSNYEITNDDRTYNSVGASTNKKRCQRLCWADPTKIWVRRSH